MDGPSLSQTLTLAEVPQQPAPSKLTRLTPRRQRQAERYLYLVDRVVAFFGRYYPAHRREEIESLAAEGLVLAVLADALDKPTPFARWGRRRIAAHVCNELKKWRRRSRPVAASDVPFDEPAAAASSSDRAALEIRHGRITGESSSRAAAGPAPLVEEALERARILRALEQARAELAEHDPRSAEVVRLREEGLSWPKTAAALGISESTARRDHEGALEQLRRKLMAAGVSRGLLGPTVTSFDGRG